MVTTMLQTKTIHDLLNESQEQDLHKTDHTGNAQLFRFDDNAMLNLDQAEPLFANANIPPLQVTEWAYRQMFAKLGKTVFPKQNKSLPADYMLALPADERARLMNWHISKFTGRDWLVRSYDQTCRAVLSEGYSLIQNTELLELLATVTDGTNTPHQLYASSVTPDSLNVKIAWRDVEFPTDDPRNKAWAIGCFVGNGEIGNRKIKITPYIQRHSCGNSLMIDHERYALEFTHRGSAIAKMALIKAKIQEVLPVAAELLDTMIAADYQKLPDFSDVLNGLALHHNWSDDFSTRVATGTEGHETRAGVVNGITYAAQSIESPDARADAEMLAGAILVEDDSVFGRMARIAQRAE